MSAISSAISITSEDPSATACTPSVIIVLQKGHPVAIISGFNPSASFVRFILISSFPFSDTLRIAAAMLQNSNELAQFQNYVANCVRAFGISLERRRFNPHVTIGRLKSRSRKSLTFQPRQIFLEGVSKKVVILQSELAPKGAIYTSLGEISLI